MYYIYLFINECSQNLYIYGNWTTPSADYVMQLNTPEELLCGIDTLNRKVNNFTTVLLFSIFYYSFTPHLLI